MGVVVERIRPERWETLRDLRLRALADSPDAFLAKLADERAFPADAWQQRATQRAAGTAGATFIAEVDGEPAGLVSCHPLVGEVDTVELVSMWTAPEHRRSGVAGALVDAVVAWADDVGAKHVVLWVHRHNTAARAFYEAAGFEPTDAFAADADDPCRNEQRMVRRLS